MANVRLRSKQQANQGSKSDHYLDQNDQKKASKGKRLEGLGFGHIAILILVIYSIFAFVNYNYYRVPSAKRASEEDVGSYAEERARKHLEKLIEIGPRLAGTYNNEVVAVNYIVNQLKMIQMSAKPHIEIEIDIQRPTGSFFLAFLGGFTHNYVNVSNIVARISSRRTNTKQHALLVNCHYDTVVDSPGASDDAVSCATMLEMIRALAHADESRWPTLKHSVVFLFNGAEESVLPASHGFITQHKWRDTLRAFINLDAAGAGGRELVFQTGPQNPWLIRNYIKNAPRPFASVIGQEVFETAIVPGDTDFRIFRDYGHIPGMDLAYITNGYVYHTLHDNSNAIPAGCMQRTGENVLAALRGLVCSDELIKPSYSRHGKIIFTDVLGLFVVLYPERLGNILNYAISIMVLALIAVQYLPRPSGRNPSIGEDKLTLYHLLFAVCTYVLSWLVGLITAPAIAYSIMVIDRPLPWYTYTLVIIPLYAFPTILTATAVHYYGKEKFYKNSGPENHSIISWNLYQAVSDTNLIFWSSITIFLTSKGIASAFLCMTWPASFLLFEKFIWNGILKHSYSHSHTAHFLIHLISLIVPITLNTYLVWAVFDFFLPVLGRAGPVIPTEVVAAFLTGTFTLVLLSSLVCFIYVLKSLKWYAIFISLCFLGCFALVVSGIIFPYSGPPNPHSQRLLFQHIQRKFHNKDGVVTDSDSGLLFVPMDANRLRYLAEYNDYFKNIPTISCKGAYCGYPAFYPVRSLTGRVSYKKTVPPPIPIKINLKLVKKDVTNDGRNQKFYFSVIDPPNQLRLYIDPTNGSELAAWSFTDTKPELSWNGDHFSAFVWCTHGLSALTWDFWLELKVNNYEKEDIVMNLGLASHTPSPKTPEMREVGKLLPSWSVPVSCVTEYCSYEF